MKKIQTIAAVGTLALALGALAPLAQAQFDSTSSTTLQTTATTTTTSTTTTGTGTTDTGTTGTTDTGTPGVPNTGAGGNAAMNLLVLAGAALVALGGTLYLSRRLAIQVK